MSESHPDHTAECRRIKRIIGQLEGVLKMLEDRRYCVDILNQTKAIGSAIHSLEAVILERHINHCLHAALSSDDVDAQNQKVQELISLFKKRLR